MNTKTKGILNGAIASASYGTNPLFALPLFAAGIGVNSVLFYRYAFAVVIYGLWITFIKKISLKISIREIIPLFILAILFSFSSLTLFDAFKYIEAGIACTILFIYPIMVAIIMAIFFKEKITKTTIGAILLTSIGILALYNGKPGTTLSIHGIVVVLLSALLYALYIVGVKNIKILNNINQDKMSFYIMFFGLLVYICNLKFCTQLQMLNRPILWLYTIGLSIFPTIISLETINVAIKLIGSTSTAILGALEPLTAIFFGVVIFHQHLTLRISLGITLILLGVLLIITKNTRLKKEL